MAKESTTKLPEETKEANKHLPILANSRGVALRSMEDMWRFACAVRDSGLAPKSFIKPEQILIALQTGAELGLPPMRSLQSFCVINGAARLYGDAPLALVRQSGFMEYIKERIEGEGEGMIAICETKRKGDPNPVITEFSVADAKEAGLWKKPGPWQQYKKRMLKYRARSFNLRDNFPDAFGGATIAEEYEGVEIPQASPTPQVAPRGDRKQIEDAVVKDTAKVTAGQLEDCLVQFRLKVEQVLGRSLKAVPEGVLSQVFAKFAAAVLNDTETDFTNIENYTLENIQQINAEIDEVGIRSEILELIPVPKTKKQIEQDAERHAEDVLRDYKFTCQHCQHAFDESVNPKKTPLCPKCLSKDIKTAEEIGVEQ